ncbi:hypothetical protein ACP4OV_010193 [Aristida adscensionis]
MARERWDILALKTPDPSHLITVFAKGGESDWVDRFHDELSRRLGSPAARRKGEGDKRVEVGEKEGDWNAAAWASLRHWRPAGNAKHTGDAARGGGGPGSIPDEEGAQGRLMGVEDVAQYARLHRVDESEEGLGRSPPAASLLPLSSMDGNGRKRGARKESKERGGATYKNSD